MKDACILCLGYIRGEIASRFPQITILDNPQQAQTTGVNMAVRAKRLLGVG